MALPINFKYTIRTWAKPIKEAFEDPNYIDNTIKSAGLDMDGLDRTDLQFVDNRFDPLDQHRLITMIHIGKSIQLLEEKTDTIKALLASVMSPEGLTAIFGMVFAATEQFKTIEGQLIYIFRNVDLDIPDNKTYCFSGEKSVVNKPTEEFMQTVKLTISVIALLEQHDLTLIDSIDYLNAVCVDSYEDQIIVFALLRTLFRDSALRTQTMRIHSN